MNQGSVSFILEPKWIKLDAMQSSPGKARVWTAQQMQTFILPTLCAFSLFIY